MGAVRAIPPSGNAASSAGFVDGTVRRSGPDWFAIFLIAAVALHAVFLIVALVVGLLKDIHAAVVESRARLDTFFFNEVDVDLAKLKPEPKVEEPPPLPPPPEPAPKAEEAKPVEAPKGPPKAKEDPYDQPPPAPAPAKAAAVLTAPDKPDEPRAMMDTVVTSDGTAAYGAQSAAGKGDKAVTAQNANVNGRPGGTGTGNGPGGPPPAPPVDKSQSPKLEGGTSWNCPFPPEADSEQIDQALVTLVVTVKPDGSPLSVSVVADPGHGFGRAARMCALGRRYSAGLDASGTPVTKTTAPFNVRFNR